MLPGRPFVNEEVGMCAAAAKNDGEFVSCVAHALRVYKEAGTLTGAEYGALVSCAARADTP